jgi:hypothetical protein
MNKKVEEEIKRLSEICFTNERKGLCSDTFEREERNEEK